MSKANRIDSKGASAHEQHISNNVASVTAFCANLKTVAWPAFYVTDYPAGFTPLAASIQNMGVNHRLLHILMPQRGRVQSPKGIAPHVICANQAE